MASVSGGAVAALGRMAAQANAVGAVAQVIMDGQFVQSFACAASIISNAHAVTVLIGNIVALIMIAKKNIKNCRRLAIEVKTIEPTIKDIEARANTFTSNVLESVGVALDLLKADLGAALEFVEKQSKAHVIKRFIMAKSVEEDFHQLLAMLHRSVSYLTLALTNKMDNSSSSPPPSSALSPIAPHNPATPKISPKQSPSDGSTNAKPSQVPKQSDTDPNTAAQLKIDKLQTSLLSSLSNQKYNEAIDIGKEMLKFIKPHSAQYCAVCINIASVYAKLSKCEDAMKYLQTAKENGMEVGDIKIYIDADNFDNLRTHPAFIKFSETVTQELNTKEKWRNLPENEVNQLTRNFEWYDADGSGTLDRSEFREFTKKVASSFSDTHVAQLFSKIDTAKTNQIDLNTYLNYMSEHRDLIPMFLADASPSPNIRQQQATRKLSDTTSPPASPLQNALAQPSKSSPAPLSTHRKVAASSPDAFVPAYPTPLAHPPPVRAASVPSLPSQPTPMSPPVQHHVPSSLSYSNLYPQLAAPQPQQHNYCPVPPSYFNSPPHQPHYNSPDFTYSSQFSYSPQPSYPLHQQYPPHSPESYPSYRQHPAHSPESYPSEPLYPQLSTPTQPFSNNTNYPPQPYYPPNHGNTYPSNNAQPNYPPSNQYQYNQQHYN